MRNNITIIAADDHQIFLDGVRSLFDRYADIQLLCTCVDGDALLVNIAKYQPDIALIDLSMPGANSKQIFKQLNKVFKIHA